MEKKRILLVDDETLILATLGREMEAEGYAVTTAASGVEALQAMEQGPFDLIITDLKMEGMDGLKVLSAARRIQPEAGGIILTGHGDLASAISALRLGADDYLLKPCDIDELLLRIQRILARREMERRLHLYEEILPICCVCKKIRDDSGAEPGKGVWMHVESFLRQTTGAALSHTYCPDCGRKAMEEIDRYLPSHGGDPS